MGTCFSFIFPRIKYYVIFVVDFSRYTWLYPLKKKIRLLLHIFKVSVVSEESIYKENKIRKIQSNGEGEFPSFQFIVHLEKCGIQRQMCCRGISE